jgi:hypothetical protein
MPASGDPSAQFKEDLDRRFTPRTSFAATLKAPRRKQLLITYDL